MSNAACVQIKSVQDINVSSWLKISVSSNKNCKLLTLNSTCKIQDEANKLKH